MQLIRLKYLAVVAVVILGLLIIRLVDLQLWQGANLAMLSQENRLFAQPITPDRGLILDRYGQPLTYNAPLYVYLTAPDRLFSPEQPVTSDSALMMMATDSARLRVKASRQYPVRSALSHVIGYVSKASPAQLLSDDRLRSGDNVGQTGLEKLLDRRLRGRPGLIRYTSTALGEKEKEVLQLPAIPGENVQTTLDPYLATVAFQAMGTKTGAVVIMSADTGEVLALVSTPSFDPDLLSPVGLTQDKTRVAIQLTALFQDPRQVFLNRAINGVYPPGSVFKIITALAGLQTGAFDQNTSVVDEGVLKVGEFSFANWYFSQYGRTEGVVSLVKALTRSNDIFFYKAAEWTGVEKLAEYARMLGYGSPTGLEIGGETTGLVPDPAWKQSQRQEPWYLGNTYHLGIGQGDIQVTLLQVANVLQAVYNQGVRCHPHLLSDSKSNCESLPLESQNLNLVMTGLLGACSPGGTGYPFFDLNAKRDVTAPLVDQLKDGAVVCKTGTAEFGAQEGGRRRTHGLFVLGLATAPLLAGDDSTRSAQLLVKAETTPDSSPIASGSGVINPDFLNWSKWRSQLSSLPLPDSLIIAVLTESDDSVKYREGSRDAAPVARAIVDWISRGVTPVVSQAQ